MNWITAGPEIFYFAASLLFLLLSFAAPQNHVSDGGHRREYLTAVFLACAGILVCLVSVRAEGWLFIRVYSVDLFSQVFKTLVSLGLFLIVCICGSISDIDERRHNEFYFLLFSCTLALMLLVSADHLLSIYLSLELSSYSLYVLVALRKRRAMGLEAGIKYFLIGSFASAVMIFGMALLYATCGTAYLQDMAKVLPGMIARPQVILGLLFTLGGFFFKLAVFPFHFWAPDTYQGASNQVAAYIATASKVAGIAIFLRVLASAGHGSVYLVRVLLILSVVSMTLGNLAAIAQKDLKRMLSILDDSPFRLCAHRHAGLGSRGVFGRDFLCACAPGDGIYRFHGCGGACPDGRNLRIAELAGLHRRSPIMALALMVALFSLAGIPPTIGFTGKFLIFAAAIKQGYVALVIIAMINVVISLYYYLLVIKAAYLLEPSEPLPPLAVSFPKKLLAAFSIGAIIIAGFFPYWLIQIAQAATQPLIKWR